jgi:bacillithiol system protein YtxJ
MGLFGLFGSKNPSETEEKKSIPWNQLSSIDQLEVISEESKTIPVAIFKHSTRCGISRMVMNQFESNYNIDPGQMKLYYLDLLSYRSISDEIGIKFQVFHQSPQLIIIKNANTVAHASHHSIQAGELEKFI